MTLLLTTAFGAAYDCPEVNVPSDAKELYPSDIAGFFGEIQDWAHNNWQQDCIADCVDAADYDECQEADCEKEDGTLFSFSSTVLQQNDTTTTTVIIELDAVDDGPWDLFYFRQVLTEETEFTTGDTRTTVRWESNWDGDLEGLPSDFEGVATTEFRKGYETGSTSETREFDQAGACYWRWTHDVYLGEERAFYEAYEEWSLQTFATESFSVEHHFGGCDEDFGGTYVSYLNGTYIGQVDPVTWTFLGKDDDGDGWSVEGGDPDDNDSWTVPCTKIEDEEQEEEDTFDDALCAAAAPIGLAPLVMMMLASLRRRR